MHTVSTITLATLLALPSLAVADSPTVVRAAAAKERSHSVNVDPLDLVYGVARLNYEKLWNGTHGLVVMGWAGRPWDEGNDAYRVGAGVGYRWHWRGRQNSGFLGVTVARAAAKGQIELVEDGAEMTYNFEGTATMVTGNIGKRWMIGDAFNITARFGLGYADYDIAARTDSKAARDAARTANAPFNPLANIPIGVEAELSAGYVF